MAVAAGVDISSYTSQIGTLIGVRNNTAAIAR